MKEKETIYSTFPYPSDSVVDGTVRHDRLLDLSLLILPEGISSMGVERNALAFP